MKEAIVRPVHFDLAQHGWAVDTLLLLQQTMMVALVEEDRHIPDLEPISLSVKFSDREMIPREAKLLALPSVWVTRDQGFLPISEARKRYPGDFLDPFQLALPPDRIPFAGDPFDEDIPVDPGEFLDIPPDAPKKCPIHQRLYRYSDRFGNFYCDHPICWSRYRLLLLGAEWSPNPYPEIIAVIDPRDYLPDLSAKPIYKPAPLSDSHLIPIYPARPPVTQHLLSSGEAAWRTFSATAQYHEIALALKTLERERQKD